MSFLARVMSIVALVGTTGCAWMYPTRIPLRTQLYPAKPGTRARVLLVLLPGRGDPGSAFADHGFDADVRATGESIDILAVDAHLGYYLKNVIVERLWIDVVAVARQQGYEQIWVAGISMGGLGALALARDHAEAINRLFVLAPYLGPKDLIQAIEAQGGLARWTPTDPADPYQRLWQWLKGYGDPAARRPALTLGFGKNDRLAPGHRLLAQLLPADRVIEIEGSHEWGTWRQIWQRYWRRP